MTLTPGARLGRYEINASLGAGGMGEVYRARDTRLNRDVAIKVLPSHLHGDEELRLRFEREARTLASFSHPHICPIHDVGHEAGIDYLVMECLTGETLAQRLATGPLPLDEAVRIGIQIAEALAAAHAHGIVHRDLKPGNVMLTRGGVKLLDFGIARGAPEAAAAATRATPLTTEGALVGTLEYMPPEQLEGKRVDACGDLFAFGVVLHEMLTGRSPFARPTPSTVAAAVLHEQVPPASTVRPETPPALDRLIARCLAKRPEERWASARDAALVLRDVADGGSPHTQARGGAVSSRLPWALAAAAVATALGLAAGVYLRPAPVEPVRRLSILPPPGMSFAPEETPQISPDGTRLLAVTLDAAGNTHLSVRDLDALEAQPVRGSEGAVQPFWSPDGRSIGFFADGWLKIADADGGAPRNLARAPTPRGGTWSEDGSILFVPFPALAVHRVQASGGPAVALRQPPGPDGSRWFPQALPDGRYLFVDYRFMTRTNSIGLGRVDGEGDARLVDAASGPVFDYPDRVLLRRDGAVVAFTFDPRSGRLGSEPKRLLAGPGLNPITVQAPFSVSRTGVLAYIEATLFSQLTRVSRSGERLADIGGPAIFNSICASADGTRVVADGVAGDTTNIDIWAAQAEGPSRLTFEESIDFYPVCSRDGREVVFASLRGGPPALFRGLVEAPGTETLLLDNKTATLPIDWSVDGRWLLYATITERGDWDIWMLPLDDGGKPSPLVATPAEERHARISPDGRWLAYASNETGRFEVYAQPFPPTGARWQVSRQGGVQPQWRGDGRELFYLSGDRTFTSVDIGVDGRSLVIGQTRPLFQARIAGIERTGVGIQYAASAAGDTFVVNRLSDEAAARPVTIVLNWPALLAR